MNSLFRKIKNITEKKLSSKNFRKGHSFAGERKESTVFSPNSSRIPNSKQLKYIGKYLSKKELTVIRIGFLVIFLVIFYSGNRFYKKHLELIPVKGGVYTEALVGFPKYINPLYASISDVDSDIASLIYSSLFDKDKKGKIVKDLVENYTISEDGKTYVFKLKENVRWHTGEKLTTDDVVYTFRAIKLKANKSPLSDSFAGVSIEKINEFEFKFVLTEKYSSFVNLLTFGIMSKNIWEQIPAEAMLFAETNLKPVGSGPYRFVKFAKDYNGVIKEFYLEVNTDYYEEEPYIDLVFKFYYSFSEAVNALNVDEVDGVSYLPKELYKDVATPKKFNYYSLDFPEVAALYLNKNNNNPLSVKENRQALAYGINKAEIVDNIFLGEASEVKYPFLSDSFAYNEDVVGYDFNKEEAQKILDENSWELFEVKSEDLEVSGDENEEATSTTKSDLTSIGTGSWLRKDGKFFKIKLLVGDFDIDRNIAKIIVKNWNNLGVKVEVDYFTSENIDQILSLRSYDVLLFSHLTQYDSDPFLLWHSSQINGGLNFSDFNDAEVDELLVTARTSLDENVRQEKYKKFQDIVMDESFVIYLYSKKYNYLQSKSVKGFVETKVYNPTERFLSINNWYLETGKKLIW